MNYTLELKKFVSSQYLYSGIRISLAILIPSVILAQLGLLKEFFLFPLGTSFIAMTDQVGSYIRRRNSLILAVFSLFFVALMASLLKNYQILVYLEIIFFGIFFSMIGVYGQRLAAVGSLSLVVLGIFIDGHLTGNHILKSLLIFLSGCVWFLVVFLVVSKIQPYKLAGQMIGENYIELANYLKIKANFYEKNPDFDKLFKEVISQQVKIKNLQEETRDVVFRTRKLVNESTTTSRLLMLMFLNSIDLHEQLMTSENDYQKLQESFGETEILKKIHDFLNKLSEEISNIGISLQIGNKAKPIFNIDSELKKVYDEYFELRSHKMSSETLENFMILRQILVRLSEISDEVKSMSTTISQDDKLAKSLSTGLDYQKFLPNEEKLNFKVFKNNFSFASSHFRHAIRITLALLVGYSISKLKFLGIGHSYWILITIVAIMKPAYSITKQRNLLRLYGTICGAILAYGILYCVTDNVILLSILLLSMIFCFTFLKDRYFWAVLFMTIYIFLTFNFLNPGNINLIFKDRILDTAIAGIVAFLISYFVFPVWEHTQNLDLMQKSASANLKYFQTALKSIVNTDLKIQEYKIRRKDAIISLANLSDNFQRMLSEPENQKKKLEAVHQFVNTSHLITAYTASLSQYAKNLEEYPEIDFEGWEKKISAELYRTNSILKGENMDDSQKLNTKIIPEDLVDELLLKRKIEIDENEFYDRRDPNRISHLTTITNIKEILELIYDVAKEQRKVVENYNKPF